MQNKDGWRKVFGDSNVLFLKFFWEISQIPRESGNEGAIAQYLVEFAEARGLKYNVDDLFNVVIYKEASAGFAHVESLAIQNHTDMVCKRVSGSTHDFEKDPLDIYVGGNFVKARGTSLGADNGLGVAYALTLLDSRTLVSPRLECIFTTQEETTMKGAEHFNGRWITAKKIISLDHSNENEMCIGSATCLEYLFETKKEYINIEADRETYSLKLKGFKGGHSGLEICDESRANTIRMAVSLLGWLEDVYINRINGGRQYNVIPGECTVVFSTRYELPPSFKQDLVNIEKQYPEGRVLLKRLSKTDPKGIKNTREIINFVNSFENGVIAKDDVGNVILSGNVGAISTKSKKKIAIKYSIRHNIENEAANLLFSLDKRREERGFVRAKELIVPGYEAEDDKNDLIQYSAMKYRQFFGKDIVKVKSHSGLECGHFSKTIPGLQYICIGPNTLDIHSVNERFNIDLAIRFFAYVVGIVEGWPMWNN